jgi:O-antigen ligase
MLDIPLVAAVFIGVFSFILYLINFRLGFILFVILLPSYLLRFNIGRLPSTALEVLFGAMLAAWLIKYLRSDYANIKLFFVKHFWFRIFFVVFLIASVISIFVSDMRFYSFGQWRAYFLQPMLLFLILVGRADRLQKSDYETALIWSSLSVSLFAILQKIFSFGLDDSGRAVSFFTSPNAVGLYLAPLTVLLAARIYQKTAPSYNPKLLAKLSEFWLLILSLIAIVFTRSLGTVFGLFVALVAGLFFIGKRRASLAMIVGASVSIVISLLFSPLSLQKSQSISNRFTLWTYTTEFLKASPKNFFLGTGIRQYFRKVQKPHYEPKELERLIYPHNIFLNFWTETGLLGLLAFVGIFSQLSIMVLKMFRRKDVVATIACAGVLLVVFSHGLIDVPYFKNDLSMMFWVLAAYIIKSAETV